MDVIDTQQLSVTLAKLLLLILLQLIMIAWSTLAGDDNIQKKASL
jgi:hypothetical protein